VDVAEARGTALRATLAGDLAGGVPS
jgi:hypothetical protein